MAKRALITGIAGQDGAYLAKLLLEKGYQIFGIERMSPAASCWRLEHLGIRDKVELVSVELQDSKSLANAIERCQPDEVYHLAAHSFVGAAFEDPVGFGEVNGLGVTRLLEAIRMVNPGIKFFQASTAELYGEGHSGPVTEEAPFKPANPYAVAKLYAYWMTRLYRQRYGMFACSGILFNHESPLRSLDFVTRKITNAVARIALNLDKVLKLGNLDARRDWGYAPDYVKAMWLMLQQEKPDDYIIATNETHTVGEFAQKALEIVGLDWQAFVSSEKKLLRPGDINFLQGDYSKAKDKLGWQPQVRFDQLVEIMVTEDLNRWQRWMKGERFPWDVPEHTVEGETVSSIDKQS